MGTLFYRTDIRECVIVLFVYNHSDVIIELNKLERWYDTTSIGIESRLHPDILTFFL